MNLEKPTAESSLPEENAFKRCYLPKILPPDDEVLDYILRREDGPLIVRPYQLKPGECVWRDDAVDGPSAEPDEPFYPEQSATEGDTAFLSFGDNGTTATVDHWGQLMQMSRYLGPGRSSIFVVDFEQISEPWWVGERAEQLYRLPQRFYQFGSYYIPPSSEETDSTRSVYFLRNRWPGSESKCMEWNADTRWIIHDGVAIAQDVIRNTSNVDLTFKFGFNANMLIRELDFFDSSYDFNEVGDSGEANSNYASGEGPKGYTFLKVHRLPVEKSREGDDGRLDPKTKMHSTAPTADQTPAPLSPDAVGLVLGIFVDGKAQKWKDFEAGKDLTIKAGSSMEFIVGHKLVLLSSAELDWRPLIFRADQVDIDRILAETSSHYFKDDGLDYATRRNVEHILSVCTIPVSPAYIWDHVQVEAASSAEQPNSMVALTSGDMAGHRVFASASYFAFKFLIAVSEHLRRHNSEFSAQLRARIQETCKAHLRWVFKMLEIKDRCFIHSSWVNGRDIEPEDHLRLNPPTDTPYQILKAFAYYEHCNDPQQREFVVDLLHNASSQIAMSWVEKLDEENKRDSYAWRHSALTDIGTFRLDDHVWIWKTLRAISLMLDWDARTKKSSRARDRPKEDDDADKSPVSLMKKYEPGRVLREITRRFTTENDDWAQKMLAVTRSARENRFLFHSLDTALFYGLHGRLQEMESDIWKSTLESQKHQQDNQDLQFENPLRYALALIMATHSISINRLDPSSVFAIARNTLLRSMLPNGLFPGQIGELTSEQLSDEYYPEFYYRVTFEIPYILWQYKSVDISPRQGPSSPIQSTSAIQQKQQNPAHQIPSLDQADSGLTIALHDTKNGAAKLFATREQPLLKRKIPYGNFIEQNIVDVEEEWLYNYPDFFDFQPPAKTLSWKVLEEQLMDGRYSQVIQDAIQEYASLKSIDPALPYVPAASDLPEEFIFAMDVSKKKARAKSRSMAYVHMPTITNATGLWAQLQMRRTAENAKKRFISLRPPTLQSALMCLLSVPPAEMDPMSLFFDHHANQDTYFFDEANRAHNTWETEFHASFFQFLSNAQESVANPVLRPMRESLPKLGGRRLARASIGFRFIGDFFDRFWTFHLVCSVHYVEDEASENRKALKSILGSVSLSNPVWQQRKVLELIQYISILLEMNRSTKEILDTINKRLGVQKGRLSLANLRSDEYFKVSIEWEDYGEILEAIDGNFTSVMERISEWENRERDRQQEQPRWTKSDDRKYRCDINAFLTVSRKKTMELKAHQAMVKSLRTSLNATQERIRNELDLRGNENIRYFTYATVIFLPLGFASSVFSMQGAPSHLTLKQMIICAAVGFMITVLFLTFIQRVISKFERLWLEWNRSLPQHWHSIRKEKSKADNDDMAKYKPYGGPDEGTKKEPLRFQVRLRQALDKVRVRRSKTDPKDKKDMDQDQNVPKSENRRVSSSGIGPNYGASEAV